MANTCVFVCIQYNLLAMVINWPEGLLCMCHDIFLELQSHCMQTLTHLHG